MEAAALKDGTCEHDGDLGYCRLPSRQPAWSPDGLWIANYSEYLGNDEIFLTDVDGLLQLNLTNTAGSDFQASWRPKG